MFITLITLITVQNGDDNLIKVCLFSNYINNELSENELEEKLRALEYCDLITQGSSNFRYCGIPDDILDLIFRDLYQEEFNRQKPQIVDELTAKVATLEQEKQSLMGTLNELKGS